MNIHSGHENSEEPIARRSTVPAGPGEGLTLFQQGHRVLVVENDFILAQDLRRELERVGAEVMGPASSVDEALRILRAGPVPDAAILDVFLDDETVYPVAIALEERRVPYVFAINRLAWALPQTFQEVPRTEKPVTLRRLARALTERSLGSPGAAP